MLYLDKTVQDNEIIVTISEATDNNSGAYTILLHSHFTHKTYTIPLGKNMSDHTERFDRFIIHETLFHDFEDGVYIYKIIDSANPDIILEIGYLKIVGSTTPDEYINLDTTETDDDYIVYEY